MSNYNQYEIQSIKIAFIICLILLFLAVPFLSKGQSIDTTCIPNTKLIEIANHVDSLQTTLNDAIVIDSIQHEIIQVQDSVINAQSKKVITDSLLIGQLKFRLNMSEEYWRNPISLPSSKQEWWKSGTAKFIYGVFSGMATIYMGAVVVNKLK